MIGYKLAQKQADRVTKQTESEIRDQSKVSGRRRGRQQSIKRRVIRLVLIPSIVAVVLWLVASGYLVFQGFYNREVANGVRNVSIPAVPALASIQQERRLSVAYLAESTGDLKELLAQRQQTDQRLTELRDAANSALALAPDNIVSKWTALTDKLDQLPTVRSTVDSRSTGGQSVYEFYNQLLDTATVLFDTQARTAPDVTSSQGGLVATEAFQISDTMSRAGSIIDGAFGSRALSQEDYLGFVDLVAGYHAQLTNLFPHLEAEARKRYDALTESDSWKELVAAEDAIITSGVWHNGVPRTVPVNKARWGVITNEVNNDLINVAITQADQASARALRTGNTQLLTASLGSLIALSIAIAAILWAIRQSRVLVDQALSVRLAKLGQDAAAMVDQRLPAMMDRLRRREKVDLEAELPLQDYGKDEIGQVAEVIHRSLQAAAGAAADEAKTRAASMAMLMGVARRPQRPLQRGLKVIEDLQNRMGDEELLTELFDINHQLTQTRRFLENLVILAGGQIGRRFQNPVPIRRVLLAAFAEAQHYQRITLRSAPDVALSGQAVTGTIHLLAELLDNALVFSPPGTTVWVTCIEVKRGVVVEIEDAGVGMKEDALAVANELLATAPIPDVAALKSGAQVGLHVVAELAKRDGVRVSLRTSAYGGLLAIVLLPERLIATDPADPANPIMDRRESAVPVAAMVGSAVSDDGGRYESRRVPTSPVAMPSAGSVELVPAPNGATQATQALRAPYTGDGRWSERAGGILGEQLPNAGAISWRADTSSWQPDTPVGRAASAGPTGTGTGTSASPSPSPQPAARPPLPHRQPQQHLVPELRDDEEPVYGASGGAGSARSPEEARDRMTRYQRAWAAGLAAGDQETQTRDDQGRKA